MLVYYFMHKRKRSKLFASHETGSKKADGWIWASWIILSHLFLSRTDKEQHFLELLHEERNI